MNDAHQRTHVAIVGGGMVGISLALMLSQVVDEHGRPMNISLIEKFSFPNTDNSSILQASFDARSTALSAGSVELLKRMQVWESLAAHAEPIRDIHISDRGHYGNTLLHADDYGLTSLGSVVENRHLGQCLLSRLQQSSIDCIAPATVEKCTLKKNGALLAINNNKQSTELLADVVLVADGADSALRQSLGIDSDIKPYQQSAIITNVALDKPHHGVAYERFTEQGPLAFLPLSDCDGLHRAAVVWTRDNQYVDEIMTLDDDEFIQQLQSCFGYRAGRIQQVGKRDNYPLNLIQAKEQVRSHIVVLGNAAHFLHPVAGQGFNLSLRDCEVLVDVLAQTFIQQQPLGHLTNLQRYLQRRESDQRMTIGLTDTMVKTFSSTNLSLSVLRQFGLYSLQVLPAAKKILAKQMMGMA